MVPKVFVLDTVLVEKSVTCEVSALKAVLISACMELISTKHFCKMFYCLN